MRVLIRWEHVKKNKNLRFLMVAPDFMGKTMEKTCFSSPAFATSPSGHWNSPKEHPLLEIDEQNSHRLTLEI